MTLTSPHLREAGECKSESLGSGPTAWTGLSVFGETPVGYVGMCAVPMAALVT